MKEPLKALHQWLTINIDNYVALCEAGSVPAGDKWIEGRSDHDIAIVVNRENSSTADKVRSYLASSEFDDSYHFFFINRSDFLASDSHPQAISSKFRGQTLFGEDLVALKDIPSKEMAKEFYEQSLHKLSGSISRRLLNSSYWSEEKVRNEFYQIFKDVFMYLAAKHFTETGEYPVSRQDVVRVYNNKTLVKLLESLESYNEASKKEIIKLAEDVLELQKNI